MAFAPYYGGLTQWDRSFVSRRLDELVEAATISGEAIVSATGYLGGDVAGVRRVEALLHQERVDPDFTVRVLSCGGWIDSLSSDEYLRLLSAIAGPKFEHAAAVIDIFGMWQHGRRPIEEHSQSSRGAAWRVDRLSPRTKATIAMSSRLSWRDPIPSVV